jgi:hypothetical protein
MAFFETNETLSVAANDIIMMPSVNPAPIDWTPSLKPKDGPARQPKVDKPTPNPKNGI